MEKTIICLAKKLTESEAANEELRKKIMNLEHSLLVADERYDELMRDFQSVSRELDQCQAYIRNLEKMRKSEQPHDERKNKGNTNPRTHAQLGALKLGREKAAAGRAADNDPTADYMSLAAEQN